MFKPSTVVRFTNLRRDQGSRFLAGTGMTADAPEPVPGHEAVDLNGSLAAALSPVGFQLLPFPPFSVWVHVLANNTASFQPISPRIATPYIATEPTPKIT